MRAAHFCESCGKVQPPVPVDYFSFFGLPPKLSLDVAALEKDFYDMSRKLHPDLNASTAPEEQEWSLEQSSMLNDAYRTLKDPIKRTAYLLHLEGVELEEQSKHATEQARATGEIKKQIVPPDLLEEVFELNMQLEELRMNKKMGEDDPAGTADSLEGLGQPDRSQPGHSGRARTSKGQDGRRAEPAQLHPEPGERCECGTGKLRKSNH
jgi:Fe-S protein assembly co-chaperone HscB